MIKANELRIGNWFKYISTKRESTVDNIKTDNRIYGSIKAINCTSIKDIEPIPLTEEWLVKFGFEKHPHVDGGASYYTLDFFEDIYEDLALLSNEDFTLELFPYSKKYKYVHQVQNLYFALTGEELTIEDQD